MIDKDNNFNRFEDFQIYDLRIGIWDLENDLSYEFDLVYLLRFSARKRFSVDGYIMVNLTKEQRRKNMQANKSAGTKPEILLAKMLFARGHRYRKNNKTVFGKPDFTFKKLKIAIFVDGEFWH